ncbi:MAG: hypothetical protein OXH52_19125 [Gammaproteobacteria bacterium]|nr:hypothetical protein [Gammaproteobacteria bacterium]
MTRHERSVVEHLSPKIVSILAVGVVLAGLILTGLRSVRIELHDVRADVGDLRERIARLEGLFEGFIRNVSPGEPDSN